MVAIKELYEKKVWGWVRYYRPFVIFFLGEPIKTHKKRSANINRSNQHIKKLYVHYRTGVMDIYIYPLTQKHWKVRKSKNNKDLH